MSDSGSPPDLGGFRPVGRIEGFRPVGRVGGEPAAPADGPGFFQRLWDGMLGRDVSRAGRFGMGAADPAVGLGQLAAKGGFGLMPPPGLSGERMVQYQKEMVGASGAMDEAVRQREARYEQGRGQAGDRGIDWMRMGGNVVGSAPLAVSPVGVGGSMAARAGIGAATGALGGAMQPVAGGRDFWDEKLRQAGAGAVVGGALGAVGGMMAPHLGSDAQAVADRGVSLTPGMRSGMQGTERKLQAFPLLRGYLEGQTGRSVEDYNRATVRQALEPIGAVMPRAVRAGHDMVRFMDDAIDTAYNRLLPMMQPLDRGTVDAAINTNPAFQQFLGELGTDTAARLNRIVSNQVLDRFDKATGLMDGPLFKRVEGHLSGRATSFAGTKDAELAEGLRMVNQILRDELVSANPQLAPALRNINYSYAMAARVKDAATRRSGSESVFTPADMLQAIKSEDPTRGHRAFAEGDALMQEFATQAHRVLGRSIVPYEDLSASSAIVGALPGAAGRALYGPLNQAQRRPWIGRGVMAGPGVAGSGAGEGVSPRASRRPRASVGGP